MNDDEVSPQTEKKILHGVAVAVANTFEAWNLEIPSQWEALLEVPEWQKKAAGKVFSPMARGILEKDFDSMKEEEAAGFLLGSLFASLNGMATQESPEELKGGLKVPELFIPENGEQLTDIQIHEWLQDQPIGYRVGFLASYSEGLKAFTLEEDSIELGNRSVLYLTLLAYADDLRFLTSWKQFQAFVGEFVPYYKGSMDGLRKAVNAIGFNPVSR